MKLVPHILHVVVISVLLAPFYASAQTDEDSHVPFGLTCDVVQVEGEEHDLVFDLDLGPGDWVVSSHSTDSMFGKFSLRFQEPQAIQLMGSMEEFPPSAWEVEHFSQLDIKVIRQDTRLVQRVAINKAQRRVEWKCSSFWNPVHAVQDICVAAEVDRRWAVVCRLSQPLSEPSSMWQGGRFFVVGNEKVAIPCVQPTFEEKHGHSQEDCGGFVGQGVPRFDAQSTAKKDGGHHKP